MNESDKFRPLEIGGKKDRIYQSRGWRIYEGFREGKSLREVALEITDGNELAAYHSGMRYAAKNHLPIDRIPQDRPWRIQPARAPDQIRYPMSEEQYNRIMLGKDQGKSAAQSSLETGIREDWVQQIRDTPGGYSAEAQEWIQGGHARDTAEPPMKRPRTGPGPEGAGQPRPGTSGATQEPQPGTSGATQEPQPGTSGATQQPQPGTSGTAQQDPVASPKPEPSWGSQQLKQFNEDHTKLSQAESDSIDAWLDGEGPAPQSLQAELTARGYTDITPEMIRSYFTEKNPRLTTHQMQRITEFLGI